MQRAGVIQKEEVDLNPLGKRRHLRRTSDRELRSFVESPANLALINHNANRIKDGFGGINVIN